MQSMIYKINQFFNFALNLSIVFEKKNNIHHKNLYFCISSISILDWNDNWNWLIEFLYLFLQCYQNLFALNCEITWTKLLPVYWFGINRI